MGTTPLPLPNDALGCQTGPAPTPIPTQPNSPLPTPPVSPLAVPGVVRSPHDAIVPLASDSLLSADRLTTVASEVVLHKGVFPGNAAISPDGQHVAYEGKETGTIQLDDYYHLKISAQQDLMWLTVETGAGVHQT